MGKCKEIREKAAKTKARIPTEERRRNRRKLTELTSKIRITTPRISRSQRNYGERRCESPKQRRIRRGSNEFSGKATEDEEVRSRSFSSESCENSEQENCYPKLNNKRRELATSSNLLDDYSELNSMMATMRSEPVAMPSKSEIDEFFVAAERAEKRRFIDKYNYDIDNDVPLAGRYEWVQLQA